MVSYYGDGETQQNLPRMAAHFVLEWLDMGHVLAFIEAVISVNMLNICTRVILQAWLVVQKVASQ